KHHEAGGSSEVELLEIYSLDTGDKVEPISILDPLNHLISQSESYAAGPLGAAAARTKFVVDAAGALSLALIRTISWRPSGPENECRVVEEVIPISAKGYWRP